MASDELSLLAKWFEEVVSLKNDSDREERRKRFEGLSMALDDAGSDRKLSPMMLEIESLRMASKDEDSEGE